MRDNLAEVRGTVNPKYATRIDNGEMEEQFRRFYINKFFANHTSESILTVKEKQQIIKTVRNLVVKDEKH